MTVKQLLHVLNGFSEEDKDKQIVVNDPKSHFYQEIKFISVRDNTTVLTTDKDFV